MFYFALSELFFINLDNIHSKNAFKYSHTNIAYEQIFLNICIL